MLIGNTIKDFSFIDEEIKLLIHNFFFFYIADLLSYFGNSTNLFALRMSRLSFFVALSCFIPPP